ncbi:MAG: apolipoprotein N-acyltransferase [Lachnospiraceae bacterium]|nr:apolipoprotein N-acyltransferase [Lachnospiraceae bacterium]
MIPNRIRHFLEKIKRPCILWVIFSGVLTAVAIIYPRFGWLAWISLIPYFVTLYQNTDPESGKRHLSGTGFLFGLSFYLPLFSFFCALYPMEAAGLSSLEALAVILLAFFGLSVLYSLPHALLPCALRLLQKRGIRRRQIFLAPLAIAALWVLVEWADSQTFLGMPWGRLAVSQYRLTPLIQSASLLGSCFVSFLIALCNALLAQYLWQRFWSEKANDLPVTTGKVKTVRAAPGNKVCLLCAVILFLGNLLYGLISINIEPEPTETISVAIVQGNLSSSEKWGDGGELLSLEQYLNMTEELSAEEDADLIIWTESCIPVVLNGYPEISQQIADTAADCGSVILVGSYYYDGSDRYNAVYAFYPDGTVSEQPYCKRKLVAFGEYMPRSAFLEFLVPALAELNLMQSAFTPGTDSAVFSTDFGSIGGLVCFDAVFEGPALSSVRDGAELLALLSNDAWYDSSYAVSNLLGHSVLRAVENGRCVVRGANTGISAIIDAKGRIQTESNLRTAEVIRGEVSFYSHRTLYSYVGNLWELVCLLYVIALLVPVRKKNA